MFTFSWKHSRGRTAAILAAVAAAAAGLWALTAFRAAPPQAESAGKKYSLAASTEEERTAFFRQFGWEIAPEPIDSGEVTIPESFSDVYLVYNNIQKEQGLDLLPYAGRTVQQWIYRVTNYPDRDAMRGTILVSEGRVIGGDLSTPELSGFMTGFDGEKPEESGCMAGVQPARSSTGELTGASASSAVSSAASSAAADTEEAQQPVSSAVPANAWPTD